MADATLQDETTAEKLSLEDELNILVHRASSAEDALCRAEAVLQAIEAGDLLTAAPNKNPGDYERHCAATSLLDMLRSEIFRVREAEGCEVSVSLSCLASDAAAGRLTRMRYHPE